MKRFVPWLLVLWLPVAVVRAEEEAPMQTRIQWPPSSVTVVFAPDFSRQEFSSSKPRTESQRLAAVAGMRTAAVGKSLEFSAPGGLTGVKAGPESAMASFVELGDGGARQSGCLPLPMVLERIKKAGTARQRAVEISNDK